MTHKWKVNRRPKQTGMHVIQKSRWKWIFFFCFLKNYLSFCCVMVALKWEHFLKWTAHEMKREKWLEVVPCCQNTRKKQQYEEVFNIHICFDVQDLLNPFKDWLNTNICYCLVIITQMSSWSDYQNYLNKQITCTLILLCIICFVINKTTW